MEVSEPSVSGQDATPHFARALAERREHLLSGTAELRAVSVALGRDTGPLEGLATELREAEMTVAVVGEVNRGKSTFMNALLGEVVFPSRATVWTAALTSLRDGPRQLRTLLHDGKTTQWALSADEIGALTEVVSKRNPDAERLARVDVWWPNRFARHGVVLMDTPGVNDPTEWRERITLQALHHADAAIFILDAHSPVTATEVAFLRDQVLGALVKRVLFVVNKVDQLSVEDRQVSLQRCIEQLGRVFPNPRVFPVSSLDALKARQNGDASAMLGTGLPELEAELDRFLREERVEAQFGSRAQRLERERTRLVEEVDFRLQATLQRGEEVAARVGAARGRLEALERDMKGRASLRERWQRELPAVLGQHVTDAFDRAARRLVVGPVAVAELAPYAQRGAEALKKEVEDRLRRVRREVLLAAEDELGRRRDAVLAEAGSVLGSFERDVAASQNLVVARSGGGLALAVDVPLDLAEKVSTSSRGQLVGVASAGAVLALVAGSGGLALGLFALGLVAEAMAAGVEAANARIRIDRLEAVAARLRSGLVTETAERAAELARRAGVSLQAAMKRSVAESRSSLDAVERQASLDTSAVATERARLLRFGERLERVQIVGGNA